MNTGSSHLASRFVNYATGRLDDGLKQIERCVNLLTLDQVWHRPNDSSNSIGNLVLHLNGNVRQWIIDGVGGERFDRDRPAEFAQREAIPAERILTDLQETVRRACEVIKPLTGAQLEQPYMIQGYNVNGLEAVFHVVEHFSLHTGQIVYATKLLIDQDLSLYDAQGQRIDGRNTGTP